MLCHHPAQPTSDSFSVQVIMFLPPMGLNVSSWQPIHYLHAAVWPFQNVNALVSHLCLAAVCPQVPTMMSKVITCLQSPWVLMPIYTFWFTVQALLCSICPHPQHLYAVDVYLWIFCSLIDWLVCLQLTFSHFLCVHPLQAPSHLFSWGSSQSSFYLKSLLGSLFCRVMDFILLSALITPWVSPVSANTTSCL